MARAIRKNLPPFIAVAMLIAIALVVSWIIVQEQRLRVPVLEERPFELKAEFETAQAVVPGQGQTIRVAGVRVGDVEEVELKEGVGVVTFGIEREFLPIYRNATLLLRPTTGLKDMFFELDPGAADAGEVSEGETLPVESTAPDTNIDEVLEKLDTDTRAYLRLLLVGAGRGVEGRGRDLGELFGSLGPINRDLARINRVAAQRRVELARLIHDLNLLTQEMGNAGGDLTELVRSANSALGAIASHKLDVERAVRLLPSTLGESRRTLDDVTRLARLLGPTFEDLRPFARKLDEVSGSAKSLAESATPAIRDQIRPFVRAAGEPVADLRGAAERFAEATPSLTAVAGKVNRLANMAAYNPKGSESPGTAARDEGYLYWLGWLSQTGNSVFEAQDAHGLYRRIYFTLSCGNAAHMLGQSPLAPVVTNLAPLFAPGGPCNA